MTERDKEQAPFDERAALGELEQFRADIERYRKQRDTVSDDFEEFVRALPSPMDVFPSEETGGRESRSREGRGSGGPGPAAPPVERGAPARVTADPPVPKKPLDPASRASTRDAARPAPAPPPIEAARPAAAPPTEVEVPRRTRMPVLAALVVLVTLTGIGAWMFRGQLQPETSAPSVSEPAPRPAAPADAAPAPAPPPVTDDSAITTTRTAWVRVIADGERVLERELPANARVPFKAEKTIVIRTGDGGAVRLTIRGEDQGPLGRDGDVVTRSFTVPAPPSR